METISTVGKICAEVISLVLPFIFLGFIAAVDIF